jgi:UDP-N-acetylglucosamine 2-epimerase
MRWLSIVGARPQFVKVAPICRALASDARYRDVEHGIVHTGQHYDAQMSDVFFRELSIPAPVENLAVGSGTHGNQTGEALARLEAVLLARQPDWVLLYGDTNSTLAGAIAAAKLPAIRIAHVEAGLRSFNRAMPEEINRIVADHLSDLLLCPTDAAVQNLRKEGLADRAIATGDIMLDAFLQMRAARGGTEVRRGSCPDGDFAVATVHRQENTDDPVRLAAILQGLEEVAQTVCPVVLPLHPRTRKVLAASGWRSTAISVVEPLSHGEMLDMVCRARAVMTDSGGVQKEAYFAQCPCVTLRDETEWVETLTNGCNVLAGADPGRIVESVRVSNHAGPWLPFYGRGRSAVAAIEAILAAPRRARHPRDPVDAQ